ncbi:hypothetical protein TOPH_03148 [Tolypocladium ophioglossoides CBS 100239]|uniref:Synaptobrevin n=1 Tax=Tolypocladium ophioglossoides (strain CBS 100239) TaxID=1163406 RepID=A0A0L0NEJ3_TOLOC|nr:hypothetical protein TOPH_03148 [Tolypocladium ophioglossoides CBS 100239]
MARLSNSPVTIPGSGRNSPDLAFVELSQLLSRLQQSLLHPTPERERRLRTSEYERARVEARVLQNLDYARAVLTRLEQGAMGVKAPARRLEMQGALNAHRESLETLMDRLEDLRQIAVDDDEDSSDEEDLLGDIVPTPSESIDSTSVDAQDESPVESAVPPPPPPDPVIIPETLATPWQPLEDISPRTTEPPAFAPTQTTQTRRARSSNHSFSPSPPSHTTARAALFANRRKQPAGPQTSTATAEAILDHQRAEQDVLSDSILKMASALKASSQRFSTTLEADKEVLGRAGDAVDKTERGMEAARGRMGALRRMTEGKGWWGRMMLYAWVYGLMVTLMVLVFVMPKLRF